MTKLKSTVEILTLLNKSNCGECNETTCLAFAANVFKGQKSLNECPHIEEDILIKFGGESPELQPSQENQEDDLRQFKEMFKTVDLASAAKRLDAEFKDDKLILRICGKIFRVDSTGNCYSEIHTHGWIALPVYNYIIEGEGAEPTGEWLPFRELKGGKDWARFFEHRCEIRLKQLADTYPDFFEDLLHIFAGKQVERHFDSDISLVLHPLPKVPILICYWRPEDGLDSDFHLFFDATAEKNLSIESLYQLTMGFTVMFEKIAQRHS